MTVFTSGILFHGFTVSVLMIVFMVDFVSSAGLIFGSVIHGNKISNTAGTVLLAVLNCLSFIMMSQRSEYLWKMMLSATVINAVDISFFVFAVLETVVIVVLTIRQIKNRRFVVANLSVKQSIDEMDTGYFCFFPTGRIVMKNKAADEISLNMTDKIMINGEEFATLLFTPAKTDRYEVHPTNKGSRLHLANGKSYLINKYPINVGNDRFTTVQATDVTLEILKSKELSEQREAAAELNSRYNEDRRRIRDATIEREILAAKIKIHDDLGSSLIATKKFVLSPGSADEREALDKLILRNISLLENESETATDDLVTIRSVASDVGVELVIEGSVPEDERLKNIIITAIHENLTNTIRHGHGDRLNVIINNSGVRTEVIFTNNGDAPKTDIEEHGGLGMLRKLVESSGGEMEVASAPVYSMRLMLISNGKEE